jgi:hypothetical protein
MNIPFANTPKEPMEPEQLCQVFLLYFDEEFGHMPLLITPDESIRENTDIMRLVKIHSIWFLDISDQASPDRIDLEYQGKMYFAKKFMVPSSRKKRRSGSENELFETIVLILSLPIDMDIFGGALLKKISERLIKYFNSKISLLIDAELAKMNVIKTLKSKESIKRGEAIRNRAKVLIKNTCCHYFQSVIKKTDATTFKLQKAISYLSLKGVPINYIVSENEDFDFSNIKIFESKACVDELYQFQNNFSIVRTNLDLRTQELEILLKNQTKTVYNQIEIKVMAIQNFFETEILHETIDEWLSEEELIIVLPEITISNEYLLSITNGHSKHTLFKQKINISINNS